MEERSTIILKPHDSFRQRVMRGGIWAFITRISDNVLGLIRNIILARLLAPNDFGLFGIALLAMSALETFTQTGFLIALIQTKKNIADYMNTVWTVSIVRGVMLFCILYYTANYIGLFFNSPQAIVIVRVIGISILVQSFNNIGIVYFQKEINFHKQFIYQTTGTAADFIVAISAAYILRNVWGIVFGLFAGHTVRLIVSYIIHPYKPRLGFDLAKFRELFRFGKWILGSSILAFFITQLDSIFIGKIIGITALGYYQLAYKFTNLPITWGSFVISDVAFPAYSKLQDDLTKLKEAFIEALKLVSFIAFPIGVGIFVVAPDFTQIVLGEKWMPIVPVMRVLCLWGVLRSLSGTVGSLFQGIGKPDILLKLQTTRFLVLVFLIYPFTIWWGIVGTAAAVTASAVLITPFYLYLGGKIVKCSTFYFLKIFATPAICSAIMAIGVILIKTWMHTNALILSFVISIVFGVIIYSATSLLFHNETGGGPIELLKDMLTGEK